MNIKNTIENIGIALLSALLVYFIAVKPLERQIEIQNGLIKELSMLEKYKIENTFDKVKAKDGKINLQVNSELQAAADTLPKKEKRKGFFKRLFD